MSTLKRTSTGGNVHWLTTMAIAACAICGVQVLHEGMHALTCIVVGAELVEFSALHVDCHCQATIQEKMVAGSASLLNLLVGGFSFLLFRRSRNAQQETRFFLWLFMLMNWLVGAGYWLFSGVGNVGDWSVVTAGMNNPTLLRIVMAAGGAGLYMFFVWVSLKEWGKIVGGTDAGEQIRRSMKITVLTYVAVVVVIVTAGVFNPYGMAGLPAIAALMLALGGMSPLLWMMQWFQAESFKKADRDMLQINVRPAWIVSAAVIVVFYTVVLGKGFTLG